MKTKSTEQHTQFTNTIAEKDAEIARLVNEMAASTKLMDIASEHISRMDTIVQKKDATIARLNEALDIAEHGLTVSHGLKASDWNEFRLMDYLSNRMVESINDRINTQEIITLAWRLIECHPERNFRIDNAADLAKIRELRG